MTRLTDWLHDAAAWLRPPPAPITDNETSGAALRPTAGVGVAASSGVPGPVRSYPFDQRLERLYFARSAACLDRVALIDSPAPDIRRELSHRELGHRVVVLAQRLCSAGVQPQDTVAVHIDRSSELVAVILAVWRVGAVYLPLDRAFPPAYLASLCEIAKPSLLLTQGGEAAELCAIEAPRLDLATINFDAATHSGGTGFEPFQVVSPDAPSLIMFTSGTTGQPKGVVHSQRQLINRLHWMWEDYPYEAGDVQGQRSPMNVMPSMWELIGGVLAGVPTAVAPDRLLREPSALFAWFADHGVSQLTLTPPLIKLLLDLKRRGASYPSRLRRVINGGPMSASLQERFHAELSGVTLLHDFGCTETNTYLHDAWPMAPASADGMGGYRPIANTTIHLLNEHGCPVAPGVEGEVFIHGPSVALGYLGRHELSAERFIAGGTAACRVDGPLFRTGEMAVLQANGTLRMTGRFDHQAKVNGLRVELEHVELVLGDHPGVSECAVVAHAISELHTRLTAFWVGCDDQPVGAAELQQFLAKRLPSHMVPSHYRERTLLPRRPNGKIDRMALKQMAESTLALRVAAAPAAPIIGIPLLREEAAAVLGVPIDHIDPNVEFANQGFDSALLMSFAEAVSARTGIEMPVASCFDHPSIDSLARYLGRSQAATGQRVSADPVLPATQDGMAIIGISLRVPGASDRRTFWRNLEAGVESVGEIPLERWNADAYHDADLSAPGKSNSRWGGFLPDIDQFEPQFFHLSPKDAAEMDPQQRLCLMESWRALEDAGYAPDSLAGRPVGVYIGAREPEYPVLAACQGQPANAGLMLGGDMSLIAARLSYFLNIDGPSVVVNTACSSSMTALHTACAGLRQGDAEMALVGGVCLTLDPSFYVASSKLGIFSPTGHCRAFDAAADGFVHGEGVAFVVLKPLTAAQRDGDSMYAVILGTAINQDGRSNGITAPNGLAQTRLQTALYHKLGIDPASIGYVEAHGTGTALGDVVELQALTRSFESAPLAPRSVAIGSVKPNVGHLTAASGIVGVIKTALCVHHGRLVPSINYREPNPKIDFDHTPFYVNTEARPWPAPSGGMRRAAINSFGIGGTNGHCVIEGVASPEVSRSAPWRWLIAPVSARTVNALNTQLRQLHDWLDDDDDAPLHTIAFTLACGRSRFAHGHIFTFRDRDQLKAQLDAAIAGCVHEGVWPLAPIDRRLAIDPDELAEGARRWRVALEAEPDGAAVHQLGRLIAAGFEPRWEEWFTRDERRRVALPGYPFDTESCWLLRRDEPPPGQTMPVLRATPDAAAKASDGAAATAILATVCTVLAQALGMDPDAMDPEVALSSYGMESVKAINLRFVFEAQLGVDLSVQDIVSAETARDLAMMMQARAAGGETDVDRPAATTPAPVRQNHPRLVRDAAPDDSPFALTDLQTAYLVAKVNPVKVDLAGCHVYLEFEADGIDPQRLERAWIQVVKTHPMLRAQVMPNGMQRIVNDRALPAFSVADHRDDAAAAERCVERVREELSHRCYLPGDWPLYEIRMTRLPEGTARIHVSMDSWIVDAHSAEQIYTQWQACYEQPDPTPASPDVRFRDFIHSMKAFRTSDGHARSLAYWQQRLADMPDGPALPWSNMIDQAPVNPRNRRRDVASVPAAQWTKLQALFVQRKLSGTAGVLAVFCDVLRRWTTSDRFGLVLTLQNRPPMHADIQRVVGPFTSSAMFAADRVDGETLGERARRYSEQLLEALDHGHVGAIEAWRSLGANRPQRNDRVVFTSLLTSGSASGDKAGWRQRTVFGAAQTPGTALHCQLRAVQGALEITFDAVPSWFEAGWIERMLEAFQSMLQALADEPAIWDRASRVRDLAATPTALTTASSVPMTLLQQGYLAERIRQPRQASGYIFRSFRCETFEPARWQLALNALLADHPMLKAYASSRGTLECSDAVASYEIPVADESDVDAQTRAMLQDFVKDRGWPAFRLRLLWQADGSALLLSLLDMAAFDAHSAWSFYNELIGRAQGAAGTCESSDWKPFLRQRGTARGSDTHQRHWAARWANLPSGPRLPAPRSASATETHPTTRWAHTWADIGRLEAWASAHGVSLEALLLAAYARALPNDSLPFSLGVVDDGLRKAGGSPWVGFGDATRFAWATAPAHHSVFSLFALATVFKRELVVDRQHADAEPFHALRAHLASGQPGVVRSVVMTNCLDTPAPAFSGVTEVDATSDTPGVAIDNIVQRAAGGLRVSWIVRREQVDLAEAQRWFASYVEAIQSLVETPSLAEATGEKSSEKTHADERAKRLAQLARWNATDVPYDRSVCLHTLFERRAQTEPFAVAVLSDDEVLTYGELNARANRLANHLQALGVWRGTQVAMMLPHTHHLVITALAIIKCGGAFIPLNINDPQDRLVRVLAQAQSNIVVSTREQYGRFNDPARRVVLLDAEAQSISRQSGQFQPRDAVSSDDRAYIIFTSGSTGTPKGVIVRHRPVVNLIEWAERTFHFNATDRVLFINPLSFDLSIFDLFGMLAYGASIRIVSDADRTNALAVAGFLKDEPITFWNSAPAYLQMVLPFLEGGVNRTRTRLERMRVIFLSGDWIPLAMPDAMKAVAPTAQVISLGGATEAAVWSNYFPIGSLDPAWRSIPYGRPIQNARYYILDDQREPVAVGETGDLFIGGECLSDGYINEPTLTAQSFVSDPFNEQAGAIMYRTGDRARFFVDGHIEFLGRIDHQVKLRGYRIELGEVEAALKAAGLPCAVAVVRDDEAGQRLIGFAAASAAVPPGELVDEARLASIRVRLPAYMVPAQVIVLPALPITPNGKVDRKRLMQDRMAALVATAAAIEIQTPMAATPTYIGLVTTRLAEWLRQAVTEILGPEQAAVGLDDNLGHLGFSSLHYTMLGAKLANELGVAMNPALFFRYISIAEIRDYLLREHAVVLAAVLQPAADRAVSPSVLRAAEPVVVVTEVPVAQAAPGAVAIIGMSGVMPQAADLNAFWRNLLAGADNSSLIPADRWDWRAVDGDPHGPGNFTHVHRAAFMDDVAGFDATFFSISPREAERMDPRQRLLLEGVWSCLEDAALRPGDLRGESIGLFVGATGDEYATLSLQPGRDIDRFTLSGISRTILANRVSYLFDWHGPSEVVDTACSSSLVAVHSAVRALQYGDCKLAIAGGINVIIDPVPHVCLNKIGMLAADGRCKTFDARADGYARGEGIGLILLKPLADALRDGDPIHAVIRGSAVNHGGRATALSAPNPAAQVQVIQAAIRAAGVDSGRIGYIETHGTGTALGDPIEIEALKEVFTRLQGDRGQTRAAAGSVALSSVKPNVGHLESAAGIAGLLKTILCLKHGQWPKTLHLEQVNPNIHLEGSPFFIVRERQDWPMPSDGRGGQGARLAGVSSFGFGGVNAHIVVEQHVAQATSQAASDNDGEWIPLSAQGVPELRTLCARLSDDLCGRRHDIALADVALTLQSGRTGLQERALLRVNTLDELINALTALAEDRQTSALYWRGSVKVAPMRGVVRRPSGDLPSSGDDMAERWKQHGDAAWSRSATNVAGRRIHLPTYPFAHTPYWLPVVTTKASLAPAGLLPATVADGIALSSTNTVLAAHAVAGRPVLPAAAYLVLVRREVDVMDQRVITLADAVWMQPFSVTESQTLQTLQRVRSTSRQGLKRCTFVSGAGDVQVEHCMVDVLAAGHPVIDAEPVWVPASMPHHATHGDCYAAFERGGVQLAHPYRSVQSLSFDQSAGVASLRIDAGDAESCWLLALDGALQSIALHHQLSRPDGAPSLPFHAKRVHLQGHVGSAGITELTVRLAVQPAPTGSPSRVAKYDAELLDAAGRRVGRIESCAGKSLGTPTPPARVPQNVATETQSSHLYVPRWVPVSTTRASSTVRGMLVSTGSSWATPAGWLRAERMGSDPAAARSLRINASDEADWSAVLANDAVPELIVLDYTTWPMAWGDSGHEAIYTPFNEAFALARVAMKLRSRRPLSVIAIYSDRAGSMLMPAVQALGAFGRVVRNESPSVRFSALALAADPRRVDLAALGATIAALPSDAQRAVNYRCTADGRLQAERLTKAVVDNAPAAQALVAGSVVVVSGGAGGIGRLVASFLTARGCRVALLGRSDPAAVASELKAAGLADPRLCRYLQADVTQRDWVHHALDPVRRDWGPVQTVFHAAGGRVDGMLLRKDKQTARTVLAAKVAGAIVLDEATRGDPIEHFIAFSSLASTLGPVGQSDYAYANAFLNGFVTARNELVRQGQRCGASCSVGWPLWRDGGMRMSDAERDDIAQLHGMNDMATETAMQCLLAILGGAHETVAIAVGDSEKIDRSMLGRTAGDLIDAK